MNELIVGIATSVEFLGLLLRDTQLFLKWHSFPRGATFYLKVTATIVYNILFTTKLATLASSDGHVEPIGLAYGMQNGLLLSVAPTMLLLDLMLVMDMFFFSLQMALIVLTIIVFVMGNFASIWQLCFLAACSSTQVASVICSPHRATAVCAWTRTALFVVDYCLAAILNLRCVFPLRMPAAKKCYLCICSGSICLASIFAILEGRCIDHTVARWESNERSRDLASNMIYDLVMWQSLHAASTSFLSSMLFMKSAWDALPKRLPFSRTDPVQSPKHMPPYPRPGESSSTVGLVQQ